MNPAALSAPLALRWYPRALRILLAGYLFFSKPFGYISVPGAPVFVGEMVLLLGVVEVVRHRGKWRPVLSGSAVLKLLCGFICLSALRLVTSLGQQLGTPLESLRDSSVWYYAAFALLTAYYVHYHPTFTADLIRWFSRLIPWFLAWVPILVTVGIQRSLMIPGIPLPLSLVKPPDIALSCGMAVAFVILRLDRTVRPRGHRWRRPMLILGGLGGLVIAGSQSRGGLISGLVPVGAAVALLPRPRRNSLLRATGPVLVASAIALYAVNPSFETNRRDVSIRQLVSNVSSILGEGNDDQTGTEEWRLTLWADVIEDSLSPAYLLKGQGFGVNLFLKYTRDPRDEVPLRSPHSSHLNILGRIGVPGFALWVAIWLVWWGRSTAFIRRCRRAPATWLRRDLAIWFGASVTGFLVNAAFDPSIEGPHAGIWFWVMVGAGAAHLRRSRPAVPRQPQRGRGPTGRAGGGGTSGDELSKTPPLSFPSFTHSSAG